MAAVQEVIRLVRDVRTRYQVGPRAGLAVSIKAAGAMGEVLSGQAELIRAMAYLDELVVGADVAKPDDAAVAVAEGFEVYVHGVIDADAERERLVKQREKLQAGLKGLQAKLGNEDFVARAKPEVVARERERLGQLQEQLATVEANLASL